MHHPKYISIDPAEYRSIVHLDRLSFTLNNHIHSDFANYRNPNHIPDEQSYGEIKLNYDRTSGIAGYYHTYIIRYKGKEVGRLYGGQRLKKNEIQLDLDKRLFYSVSSTYWYEVYSAILQNLGLTYHNIRYVEIAIDTNKQIVEQYRYMYGLTENNLMSSHADFRLKKSVKVHVMANGSSFIIDGSSNEIAIYTKSSFAEDYIQNYFHNNGFKEGEDVNRIECRLTWDYIRYLRNKKRLSINPDDLLDPGKLVSIFKHSTSEKLAFKDLRSKTITKSRNINYDKISIIDDLSLKSISLGQVSTDYSENHYRTTTIDRNILRQCYYQYVDTGNKQYIVNMLSLFKVAGLSPSEGSNLLYTLSKKYNGDRTVEKIKRMEYIARKFQKRTYSFPKKVLWGLQLYVQKLYFLVL